MNREEANEIKKLFASAGCTITRICGCYVDAEKDKKTEFKEAFLSLQEEEAFKYFTIFRNALSGITEKSLINMEFLLHAEAEGDTRHFLLKLRDSWLRDDAVPGEFYDKVIAAYDYGENYCIVLIHCAYDISAKTTDGTEMFDTSDYVYEFIQCTVYPVKLFKTVLCCDSFTNTIRNRGRDWLVGVPVQGFLFPAFNDRSTNIHSLLYYTKNPRELLDTLIDELLGCMVPMSAESQEETFQAIVEETLGESYDSETVKNIHENLNELVEEAKDEPVPLTLDKCQVKKLLETNDTTPEKLEEFEQRYAQVEDSPGTSFVAANVVDIRSFEVKTPGVSIKVSPDKAYLVENRMVEGRSCIVIAINGYVEVNGITVRPVAAPKGDEDENIPFRDMSEQTRIESGKRKEQIQRSLS